MKKILSTLLVVAMLLSMVIVAAVPAAADDDGFWMTYGKASQYDEDSDDDPLSVPGYEYTDDGLHVTPADWSTSTPWGQVQTTETVSLKDGVYMQVRVDAFSYDASDKWFNFNIWSRPMIDEGSANPKYGHGVQTLLRPSTSTDPEVPGVANAVAWYIEEFTFAANTTIEEANRTVVDGMGVYTLEVKWESGSYAVTINGSAAPEKVIEYMNETFGADDAAYIGFAMQSDKQGGTLSATITSFGTSADDAATPVGTDSKDPENFKIEYAEIVTDLSTVPAGQPAILMTGNRAESHLKGTPKSTSGAKITINEDDYDVHVVATKSVTDAGIWKVDNDVSYDIKDFPVAVCVTKNLCTCGMDGECMAFEECDVYMMSGEYVKPSPKQKIESLDMCLDPYFIGDDTYLYFYVDMSFEREGIEGRIHGARFDFKDIELTGGANGFDVDMIAFFRTVEEAEAYLEAYFTSLGWTDGDVDGGEDDTDESKAPVVDETEESKAPVVDETEESKAPVVDQTDAPAGNNGGDTASSGGCGGVVGFGTIAVVAIVAAAGIVTFKKKED